MPLNITTGAASARGFGFTANSISNNIFKILGKK
jgi:hypothetical protein